MYYVFCNKCGRVNFANPNRVSRCDICQNIQQHVPEKYIKNDETLTNNECEIRINEPNGLIEELVKISPEFDPYLFEHKSEILTEKSARYETQKAQSQSILEEASRKPKCLTCGSTNIRRMSAVETGASVLAFGLFSKKINKTFKCSNCSFTW